MRQALRALQALRAFAGLACLVGLVQNVSYHVPLGLCVPLQSLYKMYPITGRLRRLRQAGLLQHAPLGNAAGVDEDGEAPKGDARPDENLRPLRALEMLPAVRVRHLRRIAEGIAPARGRRVDARRPDAGAGPGDSGGPTAGGDGRPPPRVNQRRRRAVGRAQQSPRTAPAASREPTRSRRVARRLAPFDPARVL